MIDALNFPRFRKNLGKSLKAIDTCNKDLLSFGMLSLQEDLQYLPMIFKWDKVFRNGQSKICGRQPLKIWSRPYVFTIFKGCYQQISLGLFSNALSQMVRCFSRWYSFLKKRHFPLGRFYQISYKSMQKHYFKER